MLLGNCRTISPGVVNTVALSISIPLSKSEEAASASARTRLIEVWVGFHLWNLSRTDMALGYTVNEIVHFTVQNLLLLNT